MPTRRSFLHMRPAYDAGAYLRIVTDAASAKGGATDRCRTHFRRVQPLVYKLAATARGRARLHRRLRTCEPLRSEAVCVCVCVCA